MASVIWILSVVLYAEFMCAVSADQILSLNCQDESHGVLGMDSLLTCFLNSDERNVTVTWATWRRQGEERPLIEFLYDKVREPQDPRFAFNQLQMSGSNIDVSFLVRNALRTDEGKYECDVATDSGEAKAVVSLSVTATTSKPDMSSVPEKDLQERVEVTVTTAPGKAAEGKGSTAIAVVFVIVGSLLCGLLILALLRRRRTQQARRPSTHPILGAMYAMSPDTMEEGLNDTMESVPEPLNN